MDIKIKQELTINQKKLINSYVKSMLEIEELEEVFGDKFELPEKQKLIKRYMEKILKVDCSNGKFNFAKKFVSKYCYEEI